MDMYKHGQQAALSKLGIKQAGFGSKMLAGAKRMFGGGGAAKTLPKPNIAAKSLMPAAPQVAPRPAPKPAPRQTLPPAKNELASGFRVTPKGSQPRVARPNPLQSANLPARKIRQPLIDEKGKLLGGPNLPTSGTRLDQLTAMNKRRVAAKMDSLNKTRHLGV